MKCNKDVVECTCPDIEERLKGLMKGPASPAAEMNLRARAEAKIQPDRSKELEMVLPYIGKRAAVTFESKRFSGLYTQTGLIIIANESCTVFDFGDRESDYPEGSFDYLNTSRIRKIKEA